MENKCSYDTSVVTLCGNCSTHDVLAPKEGKKFLMLVQLKITHTHTLHNTHTFNKYTYTHMHIHTVNMHTYTHTHHHLQYKCEH